MGNVKQIKEGILEDNLTLPTSQKDTLTKQHHFQFLELQLFPALQLREVFLLEHYCQNVSDP